MTATGVAPAIELREQTVALLKKDPVFHRLGWRLLTDLVTIAGISAMPDGHTVFTIDFAVLAVLEGTLIVSNDTARTTPLQSPVPPKVPPPTFQLELRPGLYLRTDPIFPHWNILRIEAPSGRTLRCWILPKDTLDTTPSQVRNALDPTGLPPAVPIDILFHS